MEKPNPLIYAEMPVVILLTQSIEAPRIKKCEDVDISSTYNLRRPFREPQTTEDFAIG